MSHCHNSFQSILTCHQKALIPLCKRQIAAETVFLNCSGLFSAHCTGTVYCVLFSALHDCAVCGVSSAPKAVTVHEQFRKWVHFETMRHFARWCLPGRKPNDITGRHDHLDDIYADQRPKTTNKLSDCCGQSTAIKMPHLCLPGHWWAKKSPFTSVTLMIWRRNICTARVIMMHVTHSNSHQVQWPSTHPLFRGELLDLTYIPSLTF